MPKTRKGNPAEKEGPPNRYHALIDKIFFDHYHPGVAEIAFRRLDIKDAAKTLDVALPDNLGDVIYSFRFRMQLSDKILATQPEGLAWRIELAGRSMYKFVLGKESRIAPSLTIPNTELPDATPGLITAYALSDEQALLAIIRYNRLIDTFLCVTSYSLQNHLRTSVKGLGQIEIDELYVGLDKDGVRYVIPVQAKLGKDQISFVQTDQDLRFCAQTFPGVICRPVAVKLMPDETIAMFELSVQDGELAIVDERRYVLTGKT